MHPIVSWGFSIDSEQFFQVELFALDLRGADVVLGAQWLQQLGPVLMNNNTLTMTFFHKNTCIEPQGDTPPPSVGLQS